MDPAVERGDQLLMQGIGVGFGVCCKYVRVHREKSTSAASIPSMLVPDIRPMYRSVMNRGSGCLQLSVV